MSANIPSSFSRPNVPWQRFWITLGGRIDCSDPGGGFLTDPEDSYGKYANPDVKPLVDLLPKTGPIVLCGEPGIGKSTELIGIHHALSTELKSEGGACLWLPFREISDLADFRRLTIESVAWQHWRKDDSRIVVVVDGVDEGLLRVPNFINDLTAMLRSEPVHRLALVLACRTAEWPFELGRRLFELWPIPNDNRLYELCPLRQKDAAAAARAHGCDPEAFLSSTRDRNVIPLAARPITLLFLLDEFKQNGGLPATHRDLYERGTTNLVRETDPARLELLRAMRRTESRASDDERLRAAQCTAALLLLSGRSAIYATASAFATTQAKDLILETVAGAYQPPVTESALQEALESALFTSLGQQRFGFVHQTFAECLAAGFLKSVPVIQLRRLLCQRDSRGEHVIPQVAELAAWVASANHSFCNHLLCIQPEILLRSDVTRLQGSLKSELVAAILSGARKSEIFDDNGFDRFLGGLNHPGLAAQLLPVITSRHEHYIPRRIAMSICERCRCHDLIEPLLAIVNDSDDQQHLRDEAASTLAAILPDPQLCILEPLARGEVGPDPDDTIKGCALTRLIPTHWRIRDALPYLTSPKNQHLISSYHVFLEYRLPKFLEDADVAPVLSWLANNTDSFDSLHPTNKLAIRTVARAFELIDSPQIEDPLVKLWQKLGSEHLTHLVSNTEEICRILNHGQQVRRRFVFAFLSHTSVSQSDILHIQTDCRFLSDSDDLSWLLDSLPQIPAGRAPVWAEAISSLMWYPEVRTPCWDKLLQRINEIPALAQHYEWLRAMPFDDPTTQKARSDWLSHKALQQSMSRRGERPSFSAFRAEFSARLEAARAESRNSWASLWIQLCSDWKTGRSRPWDPKVPAYPIWAELTDVQRDICRRSARAFLIENAPEADNYSPNSYAALAGVSAFCLCAGSLDRDTELKSLAAEHWLKVLAYPFSPDDETRKHIFSAVYSLNRKGASDVLFAKAAEDVASSGHLLAFRNASRCWDQYLSARMEQFLEALEKPRVIAPAIEEWSELDYPSAKEYALRHLQRHLPAGDVYSIGLFRVLAITLELSLCEALELASPLLDSDQTLARSVWLTVCGSVDRHRGIALIESRAIG